jgi:uncharacterized protein YraI
VTARFDEVNVRSGPGTAFEAVDELALEETVPSDGWASDERGFTWWRLVDGRGWVRADTVTFPEICLTMPRLEE